MPKKSYIFTHLIKRSQKEQKNRKKPNAIFGSQMKSNEAKIEKFGSKRAKLAALGLVDGLVS